MATDPHDLIVEAIAAELERRLNTGRRVFVVDRPALGNAYAGIRRWMATESAALDRWADDGGSP